MRYWGGPVNFMGNFKLCVKKHALLRNNIILIVRALQSWCIGTSECNAMIVGSIVGATRYYLMFVLVGSICLPRFMNVTGDTGVGWQRNPSRSPSLSFRVILHSNLVEFTQCVFINGKKRQTYILI